MFSPVISCVLAVNRLDEYLPLAVESILNQSFKHFEFIIIANNCHDDLWDYLKKLKEKDNRIYIYRTDIGQLVFNLNYGIDKARGKYIARMDADDISLPSRFEKQYEFLEKNSDINVVSTNISRIDQRGDIITPNVSEVESNSDIRRKLKCFNPIAHPSLMFRRDDLIKNKGYAWSFWGEDYEYHLRAARDSQYKFYCLKDVLLHYRVSDGQMTANNKNKLQYADECALMFREFLISNDIRYLLRIVRLNLTLRKIKNKLKKIL